MYETLESIQLHLIPAFLRVEATSLHNSENKTHNATNRKEPLDNVLFVETDLNVNFFSFPVSTVEIILASEV